MRHRTPIHLRALAALVVLLTVAVVAGLATSSGITEAEAGARVTPIKARIDDASNTTQTLTFAGQGAEAAELLVEVTGAGSTVTYALTSRICTDTDTCSAYETVAIASGSISGGASAATVTIELSRPRDQYRLVLTVTGGTPTSIKAWLGLY